MIGRQIRTFSRAIAGDGPPTGEHSLGRIILRNSAVATAGSFAIRLINLAFTVYAIRLLGDHEWGLYATTGGIIAVTSVFFELGLAQYTEREIARDVTRADYLFWNMVVLRTMLGVVGTIVLVGLTLVARYDLVIVVGVLLGALTFMLAALLYPIQTFMNGHQRIDLTTIVQVMGQWLSALVGLVLIIAYPSFLSLMAVGLIVMPIQIILALCLVKRSRLQLPSWKITPAIWRSMIVSGVPFGLTSLALTFNYSIDTVILSLFRDSQEVGWYNAAYRIVFSATALLSGFLVSVTPALSREYGRNVEHVGRWVRCSICGISLVTLPAAAGISVLAPSVVQLLYGDVFAPSGVVLTILIFDLPLLVFVAFLGNVTAAMNLERPAMRIYMVSTFTNVLLNLLLVPWFGMLAAAAITVLTDGLSAVRFWLLLRNEVGLARISGYLLRVLAATTSMAVVVWLLAGYPLPLSIAAGAVVYVGLGLLLRLAERQQVALVQVWMSRYAESA